MLQVVFDTFKTRHVNVLDLDFYLSKSESSGINIYKNTISTQKHISVSTRTHMYNTEKHLISITHICMTQINTEYSLMTNQLGVN